MLSRREFTFSYHSRCAWKINPVIPSCDSPYLLPITMPNQIPTDHHDPSTWPPVRVAWALALVRSSPHLSIVWRS
ncbi:hypothetical protein AGABI2DRAFT_185173 [Agaricus bisporus var. bisporus H97]|uniref:hypothetical protein n=1 Tax=Agaricus bisporus var. bisporus (strain H97 / ATCC MYA-4626 / FGSC 10389) TaxID=936046 RepID=UPI00029F68AC|nr:hypothetical protein AGABI2DRAFT_185173 [Agaricus bisporus var. bisporus H97]EKV47177.1 hypothetical protein AGABI2DRAFT_185173 [Agaricus bisporus var. bisporus H97]